MTKLYDLPQICQTYFFPQPHCRLPREDRAKPIDLQLLDGTPIGGYWARPLDAAPTILYLHGNAERIADQLQHWPQWAESAGANIFFVDYPGYASSRGTPTFTSCCQAAMAGLEYLLDKPEAEIPAIVLAGRSVGSIFALNAASKITSPRIIGLILESGIADLKPRLAMRIAYDSLGLDREAINQELDQDFDHHAKLAKVSCPVLILHTRHDSLVPSTNSELLAEWAGSRLYKLVLFDAGDHNTIQWFNEAEYQRHLAAFIQTTYSGRP